MILLSLVVVVVVVVSFIPLVLLDYYVDINDRLTLNLIFYNITMATTSFHITTTKENIIVIMDEL